MSLLDLIRPQWKHSNPDTRANAVQNLGPENQEIFASVVKADQNAKVRLIALRKLTSLAILRSLLQDSDPEIRLVASQKVQEDTARVLRTYEGPLNTEIQDYLRELKAGPFFDEVLRNAKSSEIRLVLVKQSTKAGLLSQVALRDSDEAVALSAVVAIDRENLLQDVADHSRHPLVRAKAAELIRTKFVPSSQRSAGVSETDKEDLVLKSKRVAVLSHAQRLLDTRDFTSRESEFVQVVAEAQALGMGELQSEFTTVQTEFESRLQLHRAAALEELRAQEQRVQQQTELVELVSRYEGLVNEGASDLASLGSTLQSRFAQLGGDGNTELARRFQALQQRVQRQQQQDQQEHQLQENGERQKVVREDVLKQLKQLSENEDLDSVERQMRGLVREWERLVPLESEDPQLVEYNQLRDLISARFNARQEGLHKEFEETMAKLTALIERINSLDENQDFKEISKILRNTYLEWKDLVGEDKYLFHDIWKEYRAATARFEEMKEWESWRNEQEREHIIKEIEALLTLEDAPDAIAKLRHLQLTWKDAGFVPQPRLQELWDRYKQVTEQVMDKFREFIDEQNNQKVVNLEAKLEFIAEMERINADTTDQWKDKAKRVQQLQDLWKQAGPVPREQNQQIWDRFRATCDEFYTNHKLYLAREDGERQISLQKKVSLCEQAETLIDSSDWNGATNRLRKLQDEWKAIGPVPKAQSEEIWVRFRTACDGFFNRKREHFDELDLEKTENLKKKIALCERLEALHLDPNQASVIEAVEAVEAEWRSIGMVPKEEVDALWDRYCTITDKFLDERAATDATLRAELARRLEVKQSMVERVRELTDESGSNQASDAVRALQDEWKQLGRSGSNEQERYHQFRKACDEFFERRRDQLEIQEQARQNNLQRKILLIEQAERILTTQMTAESLEEVKHLRRLWKEVGAVPREQSDRIWKRFNAACDGVFDAVRGENASTGNREAR